MCYDNKTRVKTMLLSTLLTFLLPILGSEMVVSVGESGPWEKKQGEGGASQVSSQPEVLQFEADQPYFDYEESANVTALLGKTAVLNCRVKNIGNKTVSWIRHRDIHLLTVGHFTYTSDQRFSSRHTGVSQDWLLMIHYLQKRDSGAYECQISTTPPRSHLIHLAVVEPETVIVGGPDVYINTGSRLALSCSVMYSPEPPAFIFWYHDDQLVSYDRTRGGVVVSTEKGLVTTSRLLVQYADSRHSGLYTCAPANSSPRSVNVHVIAGDQPAAIVHENNGGARPGVHLSPSTSFSLLLLLLITNPVFV